MSRAPLLSARAAVLALGLVGVQAAGQGPQTPQPERPARDTPAQARQAEAPSARLAGRVVAADSGRAIVGARVAINAADLPGGRAALTDDRGAYEFTGLAAGRYSVTVSKSGFVSLSYGQRRPLQPGTPLQIADRQNLSTIDFRLPRGSVITGRVLDEGGEPAVGSRVRVLRYQYVQGSRQLVPAGEAPADDRGQYRVWGLNPGEYYVRATLPATNLGRQTLGGTPLPAGRGLAALGQLFGGAPDADQPVAYAPTYFPGVATADAARPITVGLSVEAAGIDFSLLRVQTSLVSGRAVSSDGSLVTAGTVVLTPEAGAGQLGSISGRIQGDGGFSLPRVPPGRYMLRATTSGGGRGRGGSLPQFAMQPLAVNGDTTIHLTLAPGGTISGTVTLRATRSSSPPSPNQFRVTVQALDGPAFGAIPNARVTSEGAFTLDGVSVGPRLIRAQAPRGWALSSVLVGGRDVIDVPVDIRSGTRLSDVGLVFTDALSEVAGTVTDQRGAPVTEYTVLAFPREASLWRPQARHIMTARPDQTGRYQLRGLPPGDYFLAVVDPAEPGEWFEPAFLNQHRAHAAQLALGEGDVRTQDFKVTVP
jgi:hypothetical protein